MLGAGWQNRLPVGLVGVTLCKQCCCQASGLLLAPLAMLSGRACRRPLTHCWLCAMPCLHATSLVSRHLCTVLPQLSQTTQPPVRASCRKACHLLPQPCSQSSASCAERVQACSVHPSLMDTMEPSPPRCCATSQQQACTTDLLSQHHNHALAAGLTAGQCQLRSPRKLCQADLWWRRHAEAPSHPCQQEGPHG